MAFEKRLPKDGILESFWGFIGGNIVQPPIDKSGNFYQKGYRGKRVLVLGQLSQILKIKKGIGQKCTLKGHPFTATKKV